MRLTTPVYALYARRLRRGLRGGVLPRHVGLVMDGDRRRARRAGPAAPGPGHRAGAGHVDDVLGWCASLGIRHVTVFVCSTENPARRSEAEAAFLTDLVAQVVTGRPARPGGRWRLHVAGDLSVLPDRTAHALREAVGAGRARAEHHVTLAIGHGGRQEIVGALRGLLSEHAESGRSLAEAAAAVGPGDIARHLGTAGHPDPGLVTSTSGEQRTSDFPLWQAAHAELYFCEAHRPAFREVDFLRALRSHAARERRRGR
ncbi:polyprenyl diphosphate synthase [Streptomyces sp. NPDC020983]|uniref:polyprenyl diphosphate synthase n=1 Tax=Streptomyces sp. NPDC020983 TaxID=3365106 RepID=UPI0037999199